jgi:mannose-6-phosphate isomerase-like protein (cupin superfamily)
MPDYAIVNLLEIDDSVGGRVEGLEGRFGRTALGSRDLGVSHWRYAPGFKATTGHRHREQEEAYLIISGSGQILLDGEVHDLEPWDLVRVAPEVLRALAAGPDGLEVVAIGGPKPEGGDGEPGPVTWPE